MDDDFFNDPHKGEDEFQGYSSGAPADVQDPSTYHPEMTGTPINSGQFESMPVQEEVDETLLRFREEEEKLLQKLCLKADEEANLKRSRKEKAAKDLADLLADKERQVEANRAVYRDNAKGPKNQNYRNAWDKIADNIALKSGDYPGTKDVARMREAILNKKQDELDKK